MGPRIVIGLGFGDEGKGMAVAHEVQKAIADGLRPLVVRFNGGPQAAHNVRVVRDGEVLHHTHAQFGSGAMLGASTYITRGMLFDPLAFINEGKHLSKTIGESAFPYVTIDRECMVVTPMHVLANREIERRRGDCRHGSTGNGVGVARACHELDRTEDVRMRTLLSGMPYVVMSRMLGQQELVSEMYGIDLGVNQGTAYKWALEMMGAARKIEGLSSVSSRVMDNITLIVRDEDTAVIFEGSQGMLLDKRVGWFPHVTYGDMDAFEARRLCGDAKARVIGVTRSYQTRHGAGPMPTEGTYDAPETDNGTDEWAGEFRTGLLDVPSLARAAEAACVDEIAVSHLDRFPGRCVTGWDGSLKVAGIDRRVPYGAHVEDMGEDALIETIEDACGVPVTVVGRGPTTEDWQVR